MLKKLFERNQKKKEIITRKSYTKPKSDYDKREPNYPLILLVIFLSIFGLLMIFSASAVIAFIYNNGDTFAFFRKQLIWIAIGSFLAFVVYRTPIKYMRTFSVVITLVSLLLLIYTLPEAIFKLEMPFVKTINGATRWIDLVLFDLQPAELFKIAIVLFTATFLTISDKSKKYFLSKIDNTFSNDTLQNIGHAIFAIFPIVIVGIGSLFILFQRDLDTIVIIVLTFLVVYYIGGTTRLHSIMTTIILCGSLVIGVLASVLEPYRRSRVIAFLQILLNGEPSEAVRANEGFQVWNGLIAIGSGGLFGVGYGESRLKLFFLQEAAYTDSIFAIIGEEFGLLGSIIVVVGFLLLLSFGLKIAKDAPDKFTSLIAVGLTTWIVIQAFLNIAANLAIIPFGGMPLPFFTYGGSNTIMILVAVGLLLNISKLKKHSNRI